MFAPLCAGRLDPNRSSRERIPFTSSVSDRRESLETLLQRGLLIGVVTVIALHFPEMAAWSRLRRPRGDMPFERVHGLLKTILRIEFLFSIVLLANSLYHSLPSGVLVYPIVLFRLAALIVADRKLQEELPVSRGLDLFVPLLLLLDVVEIGLLSVAALQLHGIFPV
jgi:hypothetical protein